MQVSIMMGSQKLPQCAILDGGMGSQLEAFGINNDPLWSTRLLSTNIEAVKNAHLQFLEAGSDIIETTTYQASVEGLMKHMKLDEDEALNIITKGVQIAVDVRDTFWSDHPELHAERRRPLVAGSVGPYGAFLADGSEYSGAYVDTMSKEELVSWHRSQIKTLLKAGVDLLAIDTIPAQKEAEALAQLLTEFPTCKAWLCFSCKDETHTYHGEKFSDAVNAIIHSQQIFGVGINCSAPQYVEKLLTSIQPYIADKVIVIYPNSGEMWTTDKTWQGGEKCLQLHEQVALWWQLGARWIGGCCRIGPSEIKNIRREVVKIAPGALTQ